MSGADPLAEFRAAMLRAGITPPDSLIADGLLHRFATNGKANDDAGWYVLYEDGLPAGAFGDWRTGAEGTWCSILPESFSESDRPRQREAFRKAQAARDAERERRQPQAAQRAQEIWDECALAPADHAYVARKRVQPRHLRIYRGELVIGDVPCDGALVVPIADAAGKLHSLEFITATGEKRYFPGGRVAGCYFQIGGKPDQKVLIAEGVATAYSVHEATGYPVACAFNAGNLAAVAKVLREKFPQLDIVVAGDNDLGSGANVGVEKAREAAAAVGGKVAVPELDGAACDFNDLMIARGADAVRAAINAAISPGVSESAGDPSAGDKALSCEYGGGRFEVCTSHGSGAWGVSFIAKKGEEEEEDARWLCSPLFVTAMTRDKHSRSWGRLLEWRDADDQPHCWAMPAALLQGDEAEVRKELASGGLSIAPGRKARELLSIYLQVWRVKRRVLCVNRLGWHKGSYVLPDETPGQPEIVFQSDSALQPAMSTFGTWEEWRGNVASLVRGNSRLVFAVCIAFGAPLLDLVGEESGGFHLCGESSTGKTTALVTAASIYGPPDEYMRMWRTTSNGLEGMAALHNDGLLVLDEINQCNPHEAGEVAYMLANGQGKARASRTGSARQVLTWRLWFLSSGEQSLATRLSTVGRKSTSGQEVRLAEIPADAGHQMGIIESLNEWPNSAALIEALAQKCRQYYGAVGREWLRRLVANRKALATELRGSVEAIATQLLDGLDAGGQVRRVARRFALAAAAGDLATRYELTPWAEDAGFSAAKACFNAWLEKYGGAKNREERMLIEQVRAFLEAHGASRFEPHDRFPEDSGPRPISNSASRSDDGSKPRSVISRPVINRAGFTRPDADGNMEYLVLREAFRSDVVKGFDPKWAATVLKERGLLVCQPPHLTCNARIPALADKGTTRVYVLSAAAVGIEKGGAV